MTFHTKKSTINLLIVLSIWEIMKMKKVKHPIQPLIKDKNGVVRFKENKIVSFLLNNGNVSLDELTLLNFSKEDREQFTQLIGYRPEEEFISDIVFDVSFRSFTTEDNKNKKIKSKISEYLNTFKRFLFTKNPC